MAIKRNFTEGRQSEQFLNEELITLYETLKYLPHHKDDPEHFGIMPPPSQLIGALNAQPADEALNYWDGTKWVPFFKSKFQITDQMLVNICPSNPVLGQLWINNGVLCYFDGAEWRPVKSVQIDDSQWSSAAFSDFEIVSPLNPTREAVVEVGGHEYVINETVAKDSIVDDYWRYHYDNQIDYNTHNPYIETDRTWDPETDEEDPTKWFSPELPEPAKQVLSESMMSQFLIPNLKTDRTFLDHNMDQTWEKKSSVCFQYPTIKILEKDVSAIHLNPGKLTKMTKRFVKVDKLNSTIAIPAYNTEFYGFRNGEYGGDFLIPSDTQDWGDYIPVGDHILLNYRANQNYDYVLAITYDFTWMKADGAVDKKSASEMSSSFYLSNLRAPINVHVNGLKLEEAGYSVNLDTKTVTINEDTTNIAIGAWSPYKKQFGYIRETDIQGRGIIRLHEDVHVPLVFVGGTLIHPLYGELERKDDIIYVPNSGNFNQMKNMQWCVVDLVSDNFDLQYQESGYVEKTMAFLTNGPDDRFVEPDEMYYAGTLSDTSDENGIYDYVLSSGTLHGFTGYTIRYNPAMIRPSDGIVLFIDGLLVNRDEIVRNDAEGILTLSSELLVEGQEYVLLKDVDGAIYDSSSMLPAFATGYLSDSLVYLNGKLLAEPGCVITLNSPEHEIKENIVDHEVRHFITDEITGEGFWKIYNQYLHQWDDLNEREQENIPMITSGYENQLTSVRINADYNKEDDEVIIYSFKFANDTGEIVNMGDAIYYDNDEEDGRPIFKIDGHYGYQQGMLNVFRNGIKLVNNVDYEEVVFGTMFRLLCDYEEGDVIRYLVEPIEHGQEVGHRQVVLTNENAIQTNIYKIPDTVHISLYPGRLTVYVNGIRIPNTEWTLLSDKSIMLRYSDYKAVGSFHNYPEEDFVDEDGTVFTVTHTLPDKILVEIRYDYDRKERTIVLTDDVFNELQLEKYEIDPAILESPDEILFYLNGQFTGLSRNKNNDYRLDRYRGCISFMNPDFIQAATQDEVKNLFDRDNYIYTAWKQMTGNAEYISEKKNALTLVWR